jgi:RNA polymerase sigma factor (sigma-70 family)
MSWHAKLVAASGEVESRPSEVESRIEEREGERESRLEERGSERESRLEERGSERESRLEEREVEAADGETPTKEPLKEPLHSGEGSVPPQDAAPAGSPKLGLVKGGKSPKRKPLTPAQQALVLSVRDLARLKAHQTVPDAVGAELSNWTQQALLGACKAAGRWDKSRDKPFASYVVPWMVGAIKDARDEERQHRRLTRSGLVAGRWWMAEMSPWHDAPLIEEDDVSQARLDAKAARLLDVMEMAMCFELPEPEEEPEERLAWRRVKGQTVEALQERSAEEKQLLVLWFVKGQTFGEIAVAMGISTADAARKRMEWLLEKLRRRASERGENELPRGRYPGW